MYLPVSYPHTCIKQRSDLQTAARGINQQLLLINQRRTPATPPTYPVLIAPDPGSERPARRANAAPHTHHSRAKAKSTSYFLENCITTTVPTMPAASAVTSLATTVTIPTPRKPMAVHVRKDSGQFSEQAKGEASAHSSSSSTSTTGSRSSSGQSLPGANGRPEDKVMDLVEGVHAVTVAGGEEVNGVQEAHKLIIGVDFGTTYSGFVVG